MLGPRKLLDEIMPWFERAFADLAGADEDIRWQPFVTALPDPVHGLISSVGLLVESPAAEPGKHLVHTEIMPPGVTQERVEETVRTVLDATRAGLARHRADVEQGNSTPALNDPGQPRTINGR